MDTRRLISKQGKRIDGLSLFHVQRERIARHIHTRAPRMDVNDVGDKRAVLDELDVQVVNNRLGLPGHSR